VLGLGAGAAHFALLRRNIDLIVAGSSALGTVAFALGRFVLTVAIFAVAAIFYGPAVVWMLAGFVAARVAAVRVAKAEA